MTTATADPAEVAARIEAVVAQLDPLERGAEWLSGSGQGLDNAVEESILAVANGDGPLTLALRAELLGWGTLQPLIDDPEVEEISVNGPNEVWVMARGARRRASVSLPADRIEVLLDAWLARAGAQLTHRSPVVDATLPGPAPGTTLRLAAQGPSVNGGRSATFTLRRQLAGVEPGLDHLRERGTLDATCQSVLTRAMIDRWTVLVSGSTGAGKTTLLSALVHATPSDRRIVTIEDVAEIQVPGGRNHARLLTRQEGGEGVGGVSHRDLLNASLRMNPDLIALGEVRGAEAADLVRAMRAGDGGAIGTLHAEDAHTALEELENLAIRGGLRPGEVRSQIAQAVDLVVHVRLDRDAPGALKPRRISEIVAPTLEAGELVARPVVRWDGEDWVVLGFDVVAELGARLGDR